MNSIAKLCTIFYNDYRPQSLIGRASLDFHSSCSPLIDTAYQSMRPLLPLLLPIDHHRALDSNSSSTTLRMNIRNRLLENSTEREIEFEDSKYILPRACKFLMSDISALEPLMKGSLFLMLKALSKSQLTTSSDTEENGRYHFVVIDPPWENKSVARCREKKLRTASTVTRTQLAEETPSSSFSKEEQGGTSHDEPVEESNTTGAYDTLPPHALKNLPLDQLVAENGIVCIWVTHKMQYINFIAKTLLPHWGLKYITTYYWLKLNSAGEPISDFSDSRNRAYEPLIVASMGILPGPLPAVPAAEKVLMSDAGSFHSHKPPLDKLFSPYLPSSGRKLELFARNLNMGWTSWGQFVLEDIKPDNVY